MEIWSPAWMKYIKQTNSLKYGNMVTFPCFFLVIKTFIGVGRVVGTIIPQFETTEMICEGLKTLKAWNLLWNPKFIMTDKSSAELEAIGNTFPSCTCFICDFHRSQVFDIWVNKGCHEVTNHLEKNVTDSFRKLAYAPTGWVKFL